MSKPASFHDELVDRLVALAIENPQVRALWVEAESMRELRRPYGKVTIHAMASEPDFQSLTGQWMDLLSKAVQVRTSSWRDTVRNARQLEAELSLEGFPRPEKATFVIECAAFLAKRPRRAVVALVDKTGHLLHVMDFSRRQELS